MTITSVGYDGQVDEVEWAALAPSLGAEYGVIGAGDWRVSATSGADRTVKVALGSGFGHGVFDTLSETEPTIQCASLVSGTRWDLIVAKRDWSGSGGTTTFDVVTGTSSQAAVFGLRETTPGVEDDQPLALVQITAGQSIPTQIVDLRVWQANGGAVAADVAAMQYVNSVGTCLNIGGILWHRIIDSSGNATWDSDALGTWTFVPLATGFAHYTTDGTPGLVYRTMGAVAWLAGSVARISGSITAGMTIATLPPGVRPLVRIELLNNTGGQLTLRPDGTLKAGPAMSSTVAVNTTSFPIR